MHIGCQIPHITNVTPYWVECPWGSGAHGVAVLDRQPLAIIYHVVFTSNGRLLALRSPQCAELNRPEHELRHIWPVQIPRGEAAKQRLGGDGATNLRATKIAES